MRRNQAGSALRGGSWILVLWVILFCTGCKDSSSFVKEGALFAASEEISSDKALVYIYWPREEQGKRKHLWVGSCAGRSDEFWSDEILPGGYTVRVVEPGASCFQAEARSELMEGRASASVSQELGSAELNAQAGRTFFLRIEQGKGLLTSRNDLRLVKPEIAMPEIRRCRRSIPLTNDDLRRLYAEGKGP